MQESSCQSGSVLKEHDYIGLSEASSASATIHQPTVDAECPLGDTDLRLGLGLGLGLGSGCQDRFVKQFTKEAETEIKDGQVPRSLSTQPESRYPEFPRSSAAPAQQNGVKRGYSAIADGRFRMMGGETGPASVAIAALKNAEPDVIKTLSKHQQHGSFHPTWAPSKPTIPSWHALGIEQPATPFSPSKPGVMAGAFKPHDSSEISQEPATDDPPPRKGQVVGWPPVRLYRRQTLTKPAEMFVKVNMDGITVGRKVDLNAYTSYESLLLALEVMFQPSNSAQGAPQAPSGRENDLKHFLLSSGSDFVLTCEDKDGDWMLVGDVPWSMFISTVRRLRITRGSEANGPSSRRPEKSGYHV